MTLPKLRNTQPILTKADYPKCEACGQVIWAAHVVKAQSRLHVLCDDPALTKHKRLLRAADNIAGWEMGYVDDEGNEVWL